MTSAEYLAVANVRTEELQIYGNIIKVDGSRRRYRRRLEMADQLIKETGRDDWAARLGMIVPKVEDAAKAEYQGTVTM
ncbi:hypothetical protein H2201_009253 [Coniosporium apollinis]|uniref:Uncharacterized protein n=1 Tax=Coniosporium apollinis TaxID=61459 RepID=A0ABQ9NEW1_9PEZI|nr:hypothetical protein H2201_009253 [Coniosporium apollinis]